MSEILRQLVDQVEARVATAASNAAEIERCRILDLIASQVSALHHRAVSLDDQQRVGEAAMIFAQRDALLSLGELARG